MKGSPQAAAGDSACVSVPAVLTERLFFFFFGWDLPYSVAQAGPSLLSQLSKCLAHQCKSLSPVLEVESGALSMPLPLSCVPSKSSYMDFALGNLDHWAGSSYSSSLSQRSVALENAFIGSLSLLWLILAWRKQRRKRMRS